MDNSANYDNTYINRLKTNKIIAKSVTDGTVTLNNGTISGLVYPVDPQDSVTKGFVDLSSSVADPPLSVQYNSSTFKGSSNLLYDNDTLVLSGTYTDGTTLTINDRITGITSSSTYDPSEIATKEYVDNFGLMQQHYIKSDSPVNYDPLQIANSIIVRNVETRDMNGFNLEVSDTLPSASDFITALNAQVGNKYQLYILNTIIDEFEEGDRQIGDGFTVLLYPGIGMEILSGAPNVYIGRGYTLDAYLLVTDITVPNVKLIVNSCYNHRGMTTSFDTKSMLTGNLPVDFNNVGYMSVKNVFLWNVNDYVINDINYSYTDPDVKNQLVVRNPTGNSIDIFDHNIIDMKYIGQIMVIQNISNYNISLSCSNMWTIYPDIAEIPSNKQMHLSIATIKFPPLLTKGSYYINGSHNVIGGTGTGMKVLIKLVRSKSIVINPGTGYELNENYPTTNLTNPSVSGLEISVFDAGLSGEILGIMDIANYLYGGYQVGDILRIDGGNNDAQIQLTDVNQVFSYDIIEPGTGYTVGDTVEIDGEGAGSGCTFNVQKIFELRVLGIMDM